MLCNDAETMIRKKIRERGIDNIQSTTWKTQDEFGLNDFKELKERNLLVSTLKI